MITSGVQMAAARLQEAFNAPFWRGSEVERSMFVLAEFIAGMERSRALQQGIEIQRIKPRIRVKMGRA